MSYREFADQEARALADFHDDYDAPGADYGYGMHHADKRLERRRPLAVTVAYACGLCGFTTPSREVIYEHANGHQPGSEDER